MRAPTGRLLDVKTHNIRRNPENPRLIFREDEMQELLESIDDVGIQVPITVYGDGERFYLLDGERRWLCARKLNMEKMPAIVQPKPSRLGNILMMFNIHSVRVAWDPMPTAIKLDQVRKMLARQGKQTSPAALAAVTGMRPAAVRRSLDLLSLPEKYQKALVDETKKPRDQQSITADLFVEIFKSQRAITRHVPEFFEEVDREAYVDAMVEKYLARVVDSVVSYRAVSKIARGESAGVEKAVTTPILRRLVNDPKYSIDQAYEDSVKTEYEHRDLVSAVASLTEELKSVRKRPRAQRGLRQALKALRAEIKRLLGSG